MYYGKRESKLASIRFNREIVYCPSYAIADNDGIRVYYIIDLRGHGLSDKPHDPKLYSMKHLTSDIIAVMNDSGIEKAHFWGYSMGGHIGFGLTRYYPERFYSYIVGGISPQVGDKAMKEKVEGYHELFRGGSEKFLSYLDSRGVEITDEVKQEIEKFDFEALKAFWGAAIFPETEGYFKEVEVPILLYVGEEDEWGHFPRAKEFGESKADVTLVSFPKRGHDVHSSKDLVFPYVKEFLENIN